MDPIFQDVLERLAWSSPFFIAMGVGIWICFKFKENNPPLSKFASYAFLIFALSSFFSILIRAWFGSLATQTQIQPKTYAINYAFATGFRSVLDLVGWGVLLLAIFRGLQPNHERSGV